MSWAKWDAEHPYQHKEGGGGVRSADKLAEMIKGTVGSHHEGVRAEVRPHGSGGSVVHKTTKGDLKRPVQPKGHKDSGDSARTTIRMAAHYRGKRGEEVGPTGEIKPEAGNTGKLRSADKLVAARDERPKVAEHEPIKGVQRGKEAAYTKAADRATKLSPSAKTAEEHRAAAAAHTEAANASFGTRLGTHQRLAESHTKQADLEDKMAASAAARAAKKAAPKVKPTTYVAEHNGVAKTRTSPRPYTHAAVYRDSSGKEFIGSFHESHAGASKGTDGHKPIKVVAVHKQGEEPKKAVDRSAERTARLAGTGEFAYPKAKNEASAASQMASLRGTPEAHRLASGAHTGASNLAKPGSPEQKMHNERAAQHRQKAADLEAKKSSAQKIAETMYTDRPTDERARQHYNMVADRAKRASDIAKTSKDHDGAAQLNRRAAELAPTENHRSVHENLAGTHEKLAENERRGEALAAERKKTEDAARAAAAKKADEDRKAAQARLAARSDEMRAARVAREGEGGAAAKPAKSAALTGQNVHKTMEGEGFQRREKAKVSRNHRGEVIQTGSSVNGGKYDISKNYDGSYRVDVHGTYGTYSHLPEQRAKDQAKHDALVDKATKALQAKGWDVKPGYTGMRGHLEVSPKKDEPAPVRSADKLAAQVAAAKPLVSPTKTTVSAKVPEQKSAGDYEAARQKATALGSEAQTPQEHQAAAQAHREAAALAPTAAGKAVHNARVNHHVDQASVLGKPQTDTTARAEKATAAAKSNPTRENHLAAVQAHRDAANDRQNLKYAQSGTAAYHRSMEDYHYNAAHPDKVRPTQQGVVDPDHAAASSYRDPANLERSGKDYASVSSVKKSGATDDELASVGAYTRGSDEVINAHLRGKAYAGRQAANHAPGDADRHVANLDSVFAKQEPLKDDLTTYRGVKGADRLFGKVGENVGGEFTDEGYSSTSTHASVAHSFGAADPDGALLRIRTAKGTRVLNPVSASKFGSHEQEILMPRGSSYRIVGDRMVRTNNGSMQRQIDLEHSGPADMSKADAQSARDRAATIREAQRGR